MLFRGRKTGIKVHICVRGNSLSRRLSITRYCDQIFREATSWVFFLRCRIFCDSKKIHWKNVQRRNKSWSNAGLWVKKLRCRWEWIKYWINNHYGADKFLGVRPVQEVGAPQNVLVGESQWYSSCHLISPNIWCISERKAKWSTSTKLIWSELPPRK